MVMLYVGGKPVGSLDENPALFRQCVEDGTLVEFRTESGQGLGTYRPGEVPLCPWNPTLTHEELDRRSKMPGKPLAEILKRLGAE